MTIGMDALHSKSNVVGFSSPTMARGTYDMVENGKLSYEEMAEVLSYNPDTGEIRWKTTLTSRAKAGQIAGTSQRMANGKFYHSITYRGVKLSGAQVAWLLYYKEWPDRTVFYADEDTTNLRIFNLKLANYKANRVVGEDGKTRYRLSKEETRHSGLMHHYGISYTQYAEMYAGQRGVCAICQKPETAKVPGRKTTHEQHAVRDLSVDHDHKTGAIRELLCNSCNHMLGEVDDDRNILLAAVKYLDKHSDKSSERPLLAVVNKETL